MPAGSQKPLLPLFRYCLEKEDAGDYVLCDVIGQTGADHQWKRECFRVVGDHEKPLMLQSLWKPKEGFSRRFEIQLRVSVEEQSLKDRDTVTAGTGLHPHCPSSSSETKALASSVILTSLRLANQSLGLCCGGMSSLYPRVLLQANSLHCPAYQQVEQERGKACERDHQETKAAVRDRGGRRSYLCFITRAHYGPEKHEGTRRLLSLGLQLPECGHSLFCCSSYQSSLPAAG